ncbi:hypothetical protein KUTeg_013154 [Tegillarca granosa]|uniref:CCHC-type domain-containing protein n=1 Tax=Tegillarca granosa TaxID=220873 RepID=A0ABQ9EY21_TEGGR|nr:hypothetical protein KUTeg_013154 [Tegillarca granosa]
MRKRRQNKRDTRKDKSREVVSRQPSATAPNPERLSDSNFRSFRSYRSVPNPTDYCFACSRQGHWRKNYPYTNQGPQTRTDLTSTQRN